MTVYNILSGILNTLYLEMLVLSHDDKSKYCKLKYPAVTLFWHTYNIDFLIYIVATSIKVW